MQEQFTAMRDLYMKNGDGFIVVYSITDAASLTNTAEIFQNLLRVRQKYHVGASPNTYSNFKQKFLIILSLEFYRNTMKIKNFISLSV